VLVFVLLHSRLKNLVKCVKISLHSRSTQNALVCPARI
jgi:hypothetical protein